jgi:hypothetical protein
VLERLGEGGDGERGRERQHASLAQLDVAVIREHAAARPAAPRDGRRAKAEISTLLGERIEVGIGRAIAALSAAAPDAGVRREQDERVDRPGLEQRVQVLRAGHLGGQDLGDLAQRHHGERGVLVEAARVHDGVHGQALCG